MNQIDPNKLSLDYLLENEVIDAKGKVVQRYWIDIK